MKKQPVYFADASFWIALLSQRDAHHARAAAWRRHIKNASATLVTTHAVLWEMLNGLAAPFVRKSAVQVYRACLNDTLITTVGFQEDLLEAAVNLYESRPDKEWGLTDCFSFVTMKKWGIAGALTADQHFEQAGFEPLLKRDP